MSATRVPEEVLTERLRLRQWRESDLDAYARIVADGEVSQYLGDGRPVDRAGAWRQIAIFAGAWRLRGFSHWAVELRSTGEFVGRVGPWYPEGWPALEIGWTIDPAHQRRGYAGEAGEVALRVCWENLRAPRVVSLIRPGNAASVGVAVKLGGKLTETITLMGGDALVYDYPPPAGHQPVRGDD